MKRKPKLVGLFNCPKHGKNSFIEKEKQKGSKILEVSCRSCPPDFFTAGQMRGKYVFDLDSLNNNLRNEVRKKMSLKFSRDVDFIFVSQWSKEFCEENIRTLLRLSKQYEIEFQNYGKGKFFITSVALVGR